LSGGKKERLLLENTHGKHWPDDEAMELLQGTFIRLGKTDRELLVRIGHRSLETDKGEF
jgi:hypothetical protein